MTESQAQKLLIKWSQQPSVREKYPCLSMLHHIPNGGKRDAIEGKHLKEMGVKAGVPDLHLPVPMRGYHSLYIEMKVGRNKTSPVQEWWIEHLREMGNKVVVCYGYEAAAAELLKYLEGEE